MPARGTFRSIPGSSHLRLRRLAALGVCLLGTCLLGTVPAWAQIPGLPATTETPPAAGGELEQLVKTLEDPQRRDRLLLDLKALLEAQRRAREAEQKSEIGANIETAVASQDRTNGREGQGVLVRVDHGCGRIIKKK